MKVKMQSLFTLPLLPLQFFKIKFYLKFMNQQWQQVILAYLLSYTTTNYKTFIITLFTKTINDYIYYLNVLPTKKNKATTKFQYSNRNRKNVRLWFGNSNNLFAFPSNDCKMVFINSSQGVEHQLIYSYFL